MTIAALLRAPSSKPAAGSTKPRREPRGLTHTDPILTAVVTQAWRTCFTARSDYARQNAEAVAMAACLGLVTTAIGGVHFGQTWRITAKGMRMLEGEKS